jgi:predicted nucleotidyltransferase
MRRDNIIAKLKAVEPALRATGLDALYLFGSIARDEGRAGSDVDVFVDPESDERFGFLQYMDA